MTPLRGIDGEPIECPACGAPALEVYGDYDPEIYEEAPVECRACGRQIPGRRVPLGEVFSDAPDPEFDFTGGGA